MQRDTISEMVSFPRHNCRMYACLSVFTLCSLLILMLSRLFSELLPKTSYVGEIGLDFGKEGLATREVQINSFRFVLKEVQRTGKVLSIHLRKAEHKTMDLLDEYSVRGATFHWFTGNSSALTRVVESGHYLSVNPAMFQSNRGRSILSQFLRSECFSRPMVRTAKLLRGLGT